jgi:uncharacterized protein
MAKTMDSLRVGSLKARANEQHGVSFEIALHAFDDLEALVNHDRIEAGERRWQTLGMVGNSLLLPVAHTVEFEDDDGEIIRIISARRANRKEKARYEKARQASRER